MNSVHSEISHMATEYSYLSITMVSYRHTLIDKVTHVEKKPKLFTTSGECGSTLALG